MIGLIGSDALANDMQIYEEKVKQNFNGDVSEDDQDEDETERMRLREQKMIEEREKEEEKKR